MTPETAVPVKETKRNALGDGMACTRHDWPHGHPRIDMIDLADRLIIKTELPDVKLDDIDLRVEDRDLVISGARRGGDQVQDDDRSRMKPASGSFLRRIPMPFDVAVDDVHAKFDNSLLRVEIRKPARAKPKGEKINVR
jgi:HSP20 family protein